MKNRLIYRDILTHCYQRTEDRGVLFYTFSDCLVYFTIYCLMARKYNIRVLALCQMPDHIHDSIVSGCKRNLSLFKCEVNRRFSRAWNSFSRLAGPVFEGPFGSAPKPGDKKARTNLIYVYNNPVERRLVKRAAEYRWNFLAYGKSDHPFSEKLVIRYSSPAMKRAIKEVRRTFNAGLPMNYALLKRLFDSLNRKESLQLTDYIISTYNVIDYDSAARFFGGFENMVRAIDSSTGNEYDLNEIFVGKSDVCYGQMTQILQNDLHLQDIHEILAKTQDEKIELFRYLMRRTSTDPKQIGKFLHLPVIDKQQ